MTWLLVYSNALIPHIFMLSKLSEKLLFLEFTLIFLFFFCYYVCARYICENITICCLEKEDIIMEHLKRNKLLTIVSVVVLLLSFFLSLLPASAHPLFYDDNNNPVDFKWGKSF